MRINFETNLGKGYYEVEEDNVLESVELFYKMPGVTNVEVVQ